MMKKRFTKKRRMPEEMSLQITSMADIFVILLVFLLKSYSTGALTLQLSPGLVLPLAKVSDQTIESLKVEITQDSILVGDRKIASLKTFEFDEAEKLSDGTSKLLIEAFQGIAGSLTAVGKMDSRILVVADQNAPYGTVKRTLTSAAATGFADFKLVVMEDQ